MEQDLTVEKTYIDLYNNHKELLDANSCDVLNAFREEGMQNFMKLGFPTNKLEDYKYTDLRPSFNLEYGMNLSHISVPLQEGEVYRCDVPSLDTYLVYVQNGWFNKEHSHLSGLPEGVIIGSLKQVGAEHPELVKKYYHKKTTETKDGAVAFNTAFVQDGLFVYIPKGVVLDKPIQLVTVLQSGVDLLANQRNLVVLEKGAQAKIMVCDHTLSNVHFLNNVVSELFIEENAHLEFYSIQNTHNRTVQVASYFFHQKRSSNVLGNFITLHNGKTRNNIIVTLEEENCESHVYGMALTDKGQHIDTFTYVDHASPYCSSTQFFKNVLDDSSTGAFSGRILVRQGAQKTNSFQTNKNICLTDQAKMNSKPQLEIYADDVKCSHGATVGQLDEEALFYLRARGIDEKEARLLLMFAFTHDIVENIKLEPLRERIRELVEKRFRGELSKCASCAICDLGK